MRKKLEEMSFPLIAPSVLSADFATLGEAAHIAAKAGADVLHLDVMDGHFVPNLSFGAQLVKALRPLEEDLFFDVHLMMTNPLSFIDGFIDAGADAVTVHLECADDIGECLEKIASRGVAAGLSIKPKTPASAVFEYLDKTALILVMTVEPGFGGQSMIFDCLEKIGEIKKFAAENGIKAPKFSIDGGVALETARRGAEAGADILVAGNAFYAQRDREKAMSELKNEIGA